MKSRCCNCNHVFLGGGSCPKCKRDAVEALVPREDAKRDQRTESTPDAGPRDLLEVPSERNNLFG